MSSTANNNHRWRLRPAASCVLTALLAFGGAVGATEEADQQFAAEQLGTFIQERIKAAEGGALSRLRGRQALAMSLDQAVTVAREHNLSVLAQADRIAQGREGVVATAAAFDPIFLYALRDTNARFASRTAMIHREREKIVDFAKLEQDFKDIADGKTPQTNDICTLVDGVVTNEATCTSTLTVNTQEEFASVHADRTNTLLLQFNANKATNWGGRFGFGVNVKNREKNGYSFFSLDGPFSANDPIANGTRYQWTTSMSFNFSTPLPYSKNFGRDGDRASLNTTLAEVAAKRSRWQYGATSNTVLADVQRRYWALVTRALEVSATVQHREIISARVAHSERMLELGQTTQYEVRQMRAQFENLRNVEETAWGEYVKASNALAELLDLGRDDFIVPSGYADALNATHDVNLASALINSYDQRPELQVAANDLESSDLVLENRRIQTRPDLQLVVSYAISQSDAVLGYRDMAGSFAKVFTPDNDDFFIGLVYRLPFGNAAAKSQYSQAQLRHIEARASNEQARVQVSEDVNAALAALSTRHSEVGLTKNNLELADAAYQSGVRRRDAGKITEFDLLQTFSILLEARVAHIQSLTAYQAAYADLARAQGLLAYYPESSE